LKASALYTFSSSSAPCSPRCVPRVHGSDAKAIHKRATDGNGVAFLFEVQGTGLSSTHGPTGSKKDESEF
jgi:hypothetical protein